MEITIGIRGIAREIAIDVDMTAEEVTKTISTASSKSEPVLLTDVKGKSVLIPTHALGYVEFGSGKPQRVGFGLG